MQRCRVDHANPAHEPPLRRHRRDRVVGDPAVVEVGGIAHDSRRVVPGDLFCCVPGAMSDGHAHAVEAVERGAVGLLCEHFIAELRGRDVVQTRVAPGTMRPMMARLAGAFYGHPARDLLMIGVTGTNGKTTVTQLLGDLLSAAGGPQTCSGRSRVPGPHPRRPRCSASWPVCVTASDPTARATRWPWRSRATPWSSRRVEGIHFDVAVFTNLSHDHLDYHGTMEEYFEAKARCSPRAPRSTAWSTPTTPGVGSSSSGPASPWLPFGGPMPPTSCCVPGTASSPGVANGCARR